MEQKGNSYVQAFITAVIIALILISAPKLNQYLSQPKATPAPKKGYSIENALQEFELIWEKDSFPVPLPSRDRGVLKVTDMVADSEKAYVLAVDGSVFTVNLQNGEEDLLIRMPYRAIPGPAASIIDMNSDMLYIGYNKTQKIEGNMRWGAGKIEAHDQTSGIQKWSQVIPGAAHFEQLIVTEDNINVDGHASNKYYLLDAKTGTILQSEQKLNSSFIWRIEGDLVYERTKESSFQLKNQERGEILWQSEYYGVDQPPIFTDEHIIFKSGTRVLALDKDNGQLIWEYPPNAHRDYLYSNITTIDDVVFFITESGTLFAVTTETGETLSSVKFTPQPIQEPVNDTFKVASGGDIILVYTGSTEQLFGFRFIANLN